jgi:anti-sigma regulatory factor (Ser/Thr protein kinase)
MKSRKQEIKNQIELRMGANPQYLCIARQAVKRAAELAGMSEDDTDSLKLAVEEALTNVIRHSYEGPCNDEMTLKLRQLDAQGQTPCALEIIIQDCGKQVDPESIQGRDLDNVQPGGLGVHIIRSVMDEIAYTHRAKKGMQLRMVKYVRPKPQNIKSQNEKV